MVIQFVAKAGLHVNVFYLCATYMITKKRGLEHLLITKLLVLVLGVEQRSGSVRKAVDVFRGFFIHIR